MPSLYIHPSHRGGFVLASPGLQEHTAPKTKHAAVQWIARAFEFAPVGAGTPVLMGPRASIALEAQGDGSLALVVRAFQGFVIAQEPFKAGSKSANWRAQMLLQSFWGDLVSPDPCPFEAPPDPDRRRAIFIEGVSRWTPEEGDTATQRHPGVRAVDEAPRGIVPYIPGFERRIAG